MCGNRLLAFDQLVDPLFERARAHELVDLHALALADAEGPVCRLVLDGGVPPAIKVEDMAGARQIQSRAARLQGEDEERQAALLLLKPLDHAGALRAGDATMQEEQLSAQCPLQMALEHLAHRRELGEDQGAIALGEHLLQQGLQACQLARAPADGGVVTQELRWMIADLLQLDQRRQDQPLAPDALSLVQRLLQLLEYCLIQRRLLARERAVLLDLQFLRQVRNDGPIGLEPTEHERTCHALELCSGLSIPQQLNRHEVALPELRLAAQ